MAGKGSGKSAQGRRSGGFGSGHEYAAAIAVRYSFVVVSPYRKDYCKEIVSAQKRLAALDAERASLELGRGQPPRESRWAIVLLVLVSMLLVALPMASCVCGYKYGGQHQTPCSPR